MRHHLAPAAAARPHRRRAAPPPWPSGTRPPLSFLGSACRHTSLRWEHCCRRHVRRSCSAGGGPLLFPSLLLVAATWPSPHRSRAARPDQPTDPGEDPPMTATLNHRRAHRPDPGRIGRGARRHRRRPDPRGRTRARPRRESGLRQVDRRVRGVRTTAVDARVSGSVRLASASDDIEIVGAPERLLQSVRGRRIALVPQSGGHVPDARPHRRSAARRNATPSRKSLRCGRTPRPGRPRSRVPNAVPARVVRRNGPAGRDRLRTRRRAGG